MATTLSRQELYDLVWSEPISKLAKRFGLSDVAVAKSVKAANIPVPERGYWQKVAVGRTPRRPELPPRAPGQSASVTIGGRSYGDHRWRSSDDLTTPILPPTFDQPLEPMEALVAKQIGRVPPPRTLVDVHPQIGKLLEADAKRAAERWGSPRFGDKLSQRCLRLLNSLFRAVMKAGAACWVRGYQAEELGLVTSGANVTFSLGPPPPSRGARTTVASEPRLQFEISRHKPTTASKSVWIDEAENPLENQLTEMAVALVMAAEVQIRDGALLHHQWRLEDRARRIKEAEEAKIEAERRERARLEREAQERKDRLREDAAAYRAAEKIRALVTAVRARRADKLNGGAEAASEWERWALKEADNLDPVERLVRSSSSSPDGA